MQIIFKRLSNSIALSQKVDLLERYTSDNSQKFLQLYLRKIKAAL